MQSCKVFESCTNDKIILFGSVFHNSALHTQSKRDAADFNEPRFYYAIEGHWKRQVIKMVIKMVPPIHFRSKFESFRVLGQNQQCSSYSHFPLELSDGQIVWIAAS